MKIYIKTFGCALNKADSNFMSNFLNLNGFEIVKTPDLADIILVNSCGVKERTQHRVLSYIEEARSTGKKVYVGGCLPKMLKGKIHADGLFDTNSITRIPELFNDTEKIIFSDKKEDKLDINQEKGLAVIPIAEGCLNHCNYCSVKAVRGDLRSYPKDAIIEKIKQLLDNGADKIYLTAQDTGCYGLDINENIVSLLKEIIKIKKDFKVRLGMANPQFIIPIADDLIEIYKNDKIMKFLHIPLQSGSDKILKDMGRNYSVAGFIKLVGKFRKHVKGINISTDIILGYPTETEEDFKKTLELIDKIKPEVINVSKFAPRPGTKASRLKQIDSKIVKERSKKINERIKLLV
ncbi:MAG: tRNA (N(6)-L-threonylcarbamoyladenosine(37)-C(2))-methylthiotransferase [Candidatus Nanoarchaeia archaeon]|nr:tRNA (N(6)-L-threonylcarbamoyladenosine(37)-C(2))-methylthiotransferase [Candidatus Nanoarchaeia archaeon]